MILFHDNCKIEINEDKIDCEYEFIFNEKRNWTLILGKKLNYKSNTQEIILLPSEIQEFVFEIESSTQKAHNLTQQAVLYYTKKGEQEPKEFFRFCVRENQKRSSQTKSYEFANELLKFISQKYNIPFSFKYYVERRGKKKNIQLLFVVIFFSILFAILFRGSKAMIFNK